MRRRRQLVGTLTAVHLLYTIRAHTPPCEHSLLHVASMCVGGERTNTTDIDHTKYTTLCRVRVYDSYALQLHGRGPCAQASVSQKLPFYVSLQSFECTHENVRSVVFWFQNTPNSFPVIHVGAHMAQKKHRPRAAQSSALEGCGGSLACCCLMPTSSCVMQYV